MNMRLKRSRFRTGRTLAVGLVAAGASAVLLAMGSADAAVTASDSAIGTIGGTGTVNGWGATPANYQWTFSGNGYFVDPANEAGSGTYTCSFTLRSAIIATVMHETGSLSGACNGPLSISVSTGTYVRAGTTITGEGTIQDPNGSQRHLTMECDFVPAQTPPTPVTDYLIECGVTWGLV